MFHSYTGRGHPKILIIIISFSTYPIKLQLFQLILPTAISALKGLADLKKRRKGEKKRKRTNVPKERKSSQVLIFTLGMYVIPKEQLYN